MPEKKNLRKLQLEPIKKDDWTLENIDNNVIAFFLFVSINF